MRYAIVYRGFYYREGWKGCDFIKTIYENHKKMLYNKLVDYDIYFHSYSVNEKMDNQLIKLLKPKNYKIEKEVNSKISYSILESTELVKDKNCFIINLRFDLLLKKPIDDWNIKYNKFNFIFKDYEKDWNIIRKVSDLFFCFPFLYNKPFYKSLIENINRREKGPAHFIFNSLSFYINNSNKIHFILNKYLSSNTDVNENELVKILRVR